MKKLTAVALVLTTTFAMANNGQQENVKPATTEQTLSYEEIFKRAEDDEAATCKVKKGDLEIECNVCDCSKIIDTVLKPR